MPLVLERRPQVVIQNPTAEAVFDLGGGSFGSFKLKDKPLNPLRGLGPTDEKAITVLAVALLHNLRSP